MGVTVTLVSCVIREVYGSYSYTCQLRDTRGVWELQLHLSAA